MSMLICPLCKAEMNNSIFFDRGQVDILTCSCSNASCGFTVNIFNEELQDCINRAGEHVPVNPD